MDCQHHFASPQEEPKVDVTRDVNDVRVERLI